MTSLASCVTGIFWADHRAPVPDSSAFSHSLSCEFRRLRARRRNRTKPTIAINATPPTAPPTAGPRGHGGLTGAEDGVDDVPGEDEFEGWLDVVLLDDVGAT